MYDDTAINVNVTREKEETQNMILPESKSDALFFLKAVTEESAAGTWKNPEGVSYDDHTNNIALHVEFRDNKKGNIRTAIFVALNLINLLHVNEQILYTRMEK